jgi:hypothetical protein
MFLGTVIDTILIAVVGVLRLTRSRVCNAILSLEVMDLVLTTELGVVLLAKSGVFVLIVGVVRVVVDSSAVCGVALTVGVELVRVRVLRQDMAIISSGSLATAEDTVEETALGSVTTGVTVGGTGAKALLLAVVADKGNFHEDGQDKEDTETTMLVIIRLYDVIMT